MASATPAVTPEPPRLQSWRSNWSCPGSMDRAFNRANSGTSSSCVVRRQAQGEESPRVEINGFCQVPC